MSKEQVEKLEAEIEKLKKLVHTNLGPRVHKLEGRFNFIAERYVELQNAAGGPQ